MISKDMYDVEYSAPKVVQPPPLHWRDVAGTDSIAIYRREREIQCSDPPTIMSAPSDRWQ